MEPIVKWAGGKKQLLPEIIPNIPNEIDTYYEPFAGGLAVLFALSPSKAVINDINSELINLYTQVRDNPEKVIEMLSELDEKHVNSDPDEFYYAQRDVYNENMGSNSCEQAARFIYINKHCFNGLYRVNASGKYNVPSNHKKSGSSYSKENIMEISQFLKKVDIKNCDFELVCADAKEGDFVFFDSPYAPLNPSSFTDYTKEGFEVEDHKRLAGLFDELSKKGVKCMLTNHNTELIRELYKNYNIRVVEVKRMINADASNRVGQEVIITNYEL